MVLSKDKGEEKKKDEASDRGNEIKKDPHLIFSNKRMHPCPAGPRVSDH